MKGKRYSSPLRLNDIIRDPYYNNDQNLKNIITICNILSSDMKLDPRTYNYALVYLHSIYKAAYIFKSNPID